MLDIELFRKNAEVIKFSQKHRGLPEELVDEVCRLDEKWREYLQEAEKLKHERNIVSEKINQLKKSGKKADAEIKRTKELVETLKKVDEEANTAKMMRDKVRMELPNIVDDSVPVGDATKNKTIKTVGKIPKFKFKVQDHFDLGKNLGIIDTERAAKVAGARFYYLKGDLVRLNFAVISFALDLLKKRGFTLIQPPFMLRRDALEGAVTLGAFEEMIYKIQDEDLYLIGTAEHALNAYYKDEVLNEKELPIRFAGISTSFRKEAGTASKDLKGIFRVHQFEKVEQFVFCKPENAWKEFDFLLKNLEDIFKALEIPYRLVILATGDMGRVPVKTIDLEGWFPSQNTYRELASCSNCTDFQARRSNIRYATKDGNRFVNTLNNTAIATERAMACILENFQQKDGSIKIPKALWKYAGFKEIKAPKPL
ncbi:MAG TPA: serine--tRNA ligase [Nanoarchaeota archaeon]|nr:serine--tRNA ligase [Nanoarchaeota archaeon]